MNDYYSQFPGPSKTNAIKELCKSEYPNWLNKFIIDCVEAEIDKYGSLGSQTGWNISLKPQLLKKINHKIQLREKSRQLLRKMFYKLRVIGAFLKLYKDIYYKPNGEYMKSIEAIYKNTFKI